MAKRNLFLGAASGSVGDVTFMRRNGTQVSRVRVRDIANPRTQSQASQRSVFAPVAKFYSPLATVLETSWEGKNRIDSYTAFLKRNINLAKENNWALPKGTGFFPLPYQLSQGTLPPLEQELQTGLEIKSPSITLGAANWGVVSQQLVQDGWQNGDQLTLIFVTRATIAGDSVYSPTYTRVYLDVDSEDALGVVFAGFSVSAENGILEIGLGATFVVAAAAIMSRWENGKWRRSVSYLNVNDTITDVVLQEFAQAVASYRDTANTPTSEVYLNGSAVAAVAVPEIVNVSIENQGPVRRGDTVILDSIENLINVETNRSITNNMKAGIMNVQLVNLNIDDNPPGVYVQFQAASPAGIYPIVLIENGVVLDTFCYVQKV